MTRPTYIWVMNHAELEKGISGQAFLYYAKSRFRIGDNAYIDKKTGYSIRKGTHDYWIGRVICTKKNIDFKTLITNAQIVLGILRKADGNPENYGVNYQLDRPIQ